MILKRSLGFLLIFMISGWLWADSRQHLYEQGNQFYTNGEFENALNAYQEILTMGYENGSLYFNIGNCYYKLGDIGHAILNYERAQKLIPSDEDLKANLSIARLSVVDQIEPVSDFIVIQAMHAFYFFLPKSTQLTLLLSGYGIFMASLILWLLSRSSLWRYVARRLIWIFGIVFVLLVISFTGRVIDERQTVEAVILADKVDVMSAPTAQGGVEVFGLHEGTKVRLDRSSEDWVEIVLPDRKVGWVKKEILEII
ncbi:tetratricopeptide repeat protein [bacterium]